MIAYNHIGLDNLRIREETDEAAATGSITTEENTKIRYAHPVDFYSPNIFICVGLFLLTVVITACSMGLFLLAETGSKNYFTLLVGFFAVACYAALEFIISRRKHFRSGVDDALQWLSAGLFYGAIYLAFENLSDLFQCFIVFIIALFFSIRFANRLMALLTYAALLALIFFAIAGTGTIIRLLLPFIIMAVSVATVSICNKNLRRHRLRHYGSCLNFVKVAALVSFYLGGNYFVVPELNNYLSGSSSHEVGISMAWLFWLVTIITPWLYLYQGVRKKDFLFIRIGLALIAVAVFTIRYYYHVFPAEWAMFSGGIIIVLISYGLTRYLKTPKQGFTSLDSGQKQLLDKLNIESLIIAETFTGATPRPASNFQFGGGSGGGGGAGGKY